MLRVLLAYDIDVAFPSHALSITRVSDLCLKDIRLKGISSIGHTYFASITQLFDACPYFHAPGLSK